MKYINIKYLAFIFFGTMLLSSCGDGLSDLNDDPNNPVEVKATNLLTQAEQSLFSRASGRNLNAEWGKLMVQQWAQNEYCEESRYEVDGTTFNGAFNGIYANVLNELKDAAGLISKDDKIASDVVRNNQLAIIDIIEAYSYQLLTDGFGDIPFTQALQPDEFPNPAYDTQADVYRGVMDMYVSAVATLDESAGSFPSGELVYGGNVAKWKKLGNSLLLRAAMRVSNKDEAMAREYLSKLGTLIESNSDNALYTFADNPAVANPLWIDVNVNNRDDFAVSTELLSNLESNNDPRLSKYVAEAAAGGYLGMPYGLSDADAFALKNTTSRPAAGIRDMETPHVIMDAAQVYFLLAEAYQRGLLSGDAATAYNDAVNASMAFWGVDGADYLAAHPYDAGNWDEVIGTQKWLALYLDGFEAWAEWRRLGKPALSAPESANLDYIPVRLPYPIDEQTNNTTALGNVTSDPNGMSEAVWWDAN